MYLHLVILCEKMGSLYVFYYESLTNKSHCPLSPKNPRKVLSVRNKDNIFAGILTE